MVLASSNSNIISLTKVKYVLLRIVEPIGLLALVLPHIPKRNYLKQALSFFHPIYDPEIQQKMAIKMTKNKL